MLDFQRSPVLVNKRSKTKKFEQIYEDMDFDFDYSDWSEKKKIHSTPSRKNLSISFNSPSKVPNESNQHKPTEMKVDANKNKEFELDFGDEFDLDFSLNRTPSRNDSKKSTPKSFPVSPDIFDQSPKSKPRRSELFSKNFRLLPQTTNRSPLRPQESVEPEEDCFVMPEPVHRTKSSFSKSKTNNVTECNTKGNFFRHF